MRALLLGALLLASCGSSKPGPCQGDLCGKGFCSAAAVCTDQCEKVRITLGEHCPEGYGCLGFNTCKSTDMAGIPVGDMGPAPDLRPADLAPGPPDQAIPDAATD